MANSASRILFVSTILLVLAGGCGPKPPSVAPETTPPADLGATVGSAGQVVTPTGVRVEGYGLVGNLPGTGSSTCPPQVRTYLRQYILSQLPDQSINVDNLINSNTTSIVALEGMIPPLASTGEHFDVRVTLIPGSETISLEGGWLYKAELHQQGFGGLAGRVLATVEGPAFVNAVDVAESDPTSAYVLGGGRSANDYSLIISLPGANYTLANAVRNRISERYGPGAVGAVFPDGLQCDVPPAYQNRKMEFVSMIAATFLQETPELFQRRLDYYIQRLILGEDVRDSEIALEAIGRRALAALAPLLAGTDEEVRFRVARVMLNLGDDQALPVLREAALNPESPFRLEAIQTVADSARRNDAIALLRILLRDSDMHVVVSSYEHLRDMGDTSVSRDFIGRSFYLERVRRAEHRVIFAARRGDPRIAVFDGPLTCRDEVFVQSPKGDVIISGRPGAGYMSLTRQLPGRGTTLGPLRTGYLLSEVIRALGAEPNPTAEGQLSGLGVSYAEILALLERMCASGAVDAQFWPGPLPEFE